MGDAKHGSGLTIKAFSRSTTMIIAMKKTIINAISLLVRLILLIALTPDARTADMEEGAVYVAGQGFTLEQAISQALAENSGDASRRFWVVVSGHDVALTVKTGGDAGLLDAIRRIHERGGIIYVCQSDMLAQGIMASDLVTEVEPVQGFGAPSGSGSPPMSRSGNPLPKDLQHARLILRSCADRDAADTPSAH